MKIFIGSDHNGFHMRGELVQYIKRAGYDVEDEGEKRQDPQDDFPVVARRIVKDILGSNDDDPRGILICGSGQGMCMAANRFRGIRAALGYDMATVRDARNDDNSNVLCLPAKTLAKDKSRVIVETWLNTPFAGATRFKRRIQELDSL
ncbi:MAG: RpiB/LacA/LacB family sugar-phosphate isomerase [Patescibacteria group bacterium]